MRNIKEYKAPTAQITEFECADVITVSLMTKPENAGPSAKDYVYAGHIDWNDNFGN